MNCDIFLSTSISSWVVVKPTLFQTTPRKMVLQRFAVNVTVK